MKVERVLYFHSIQFFIEDCMKHLHKLYISSRKRKVDNRVIIKLKRDWVEPCLQLPWSNCHLVISVTFFQQNGQALILSAGGGGGHTGDCINGVALECTYVNNIQKSKTKLRS